MGPEDQPKLVQMIRFLLRFDFLIIKIVYLRALRREDVPLLFLEVVTIKEKNNDVSICCSK